MFLILSADMDLELVWVPHAAKFLHNPSQEKTDFLQQSHY